MLTRQPVLFTENLDYPLEARTTHRRDWDGDITLNAPLRETPETQMFKRRH